MDNTFNVQFTDIESAFCLTFGDVSLPTCDNLFIATYGLTSYDELIAAHNSGKVLILLVGGRQIQFYDTDDNGNFLFSDNIYDKYHNYWCRPGSTWGNKVVSLPCYNNIKALADRIASLEHKIAGML